MSAKVAQPEKKATVKRRPGKPTPAHCLIEAQVEAIAALQDDARIFLRASHALDTIIEAHGAAVSEYQRGAMSLAQLCHANDALRAHERRLRDLCELRGVAVDSRTIPELRRLFAAAQVAA